MKITVTRVKFHEAFSALGNTDFSYEALDMLFEYLNSIEYAPDSEHELDVLVFCADYKENTWEDIADLYSLNLNLSEDDDEEEKIEEVREFLKRHSTLIGEPSPGVFLYAEF